jgi:hypothetical protein
MTGANDFDVIVVGSRLQAKAATRATGLLGAEAVCGSTPTGPQVADGTL